MKAKKDVLVPISTPLAAPLPKVTIIPKPRDQLAAAQRQNDALRRDILRLSDRILRLEREIRAEIEYWENGLKRGQWRSVDYLKRRVSELKGALEFQGSDHSMWLGVDNLRGK